MKENGQCKKNDRFIVVKKNALFIKQQDELGFLVMALPILKTPALCWLPCFFFFHKFNFVLWEIFNFLLFCGVLLTQNIYHVTKRVLRRKNAKHFSGFDNRQLLSNALKGNDRYNRIWTSRLVELLLFCVMWKIFNFKRVILRKNYPDMNFKG